MAAIDHYLNSVIQQARLEAFDDGSATLEACHLLLGIAVVGENTELIAAGLGYDQIRAALREEFEHSLQTVGVSAAVYHLPKPTRVGDPPTTLGASAKLAFDRGFARARTKKDLRPVHLLLGILQAEIGTVPRALALAGFDRPALIARLAGDAA
ncbi:Clp protease N-terminal domain-containing protein [Herbidospora yilanensis]|uniref:Clp protease N-terminal domain-containing protein n=1 Tax=Herbidospora yilanensis TaxID=354426 RepID=UPI00078612FF|nr:Clp protease N-terminal domain-containing protein [Herbidospora yilanensis]